VIQHGSAAKNIADNKENMPVVLRRAFERAGDNVVILEDFISMGFDFAQLLQRQKSIYYFLGLIGDFDVKYMVFQDSRQEEYLKDNDELETRGVLICFYSAFVKMTSSETSRIFLFKGKALYSPLEYDLKS